MIILVFGILDDDIKRYKYNSCDIGYNFLILPINYIISSRLILKIGSYI